LFEISFKYIYSGEGFTQNMSAEDCHFTRNLAVFPAPCKCC